MKAWYNLFYFILFVSCKPSIKSDEARQVDSGVTLWPVEAINIENILAHPHSFEFNLSSIATEITYVPLQTTSHSLLGKRFFTVLTPHYFVADEKLFSRQEGKYLGPLGRIGQGPGEYILARGMSADEERKEFYIIDNHLAKLFVYDFDNHLKKSIPVNPYGGIIKSVGDGKIIMLREVGGYDPENYFDYQVIDIDSEKVLYTHTSSALGKGGTKDYSRDYGINRNLLWNYEDKLYYYEFLTDSVFRIDRGYRPVPCYALILDKNKPGLVSKGNYHEIKNNLYNITETAEYMIFKLQPQSIIYNKHLQKGSLINSDESFINNDLDGGFENWTWIYSSTDGLFIYQYVSPFVLKEKLRERGHKSKNYDLVKREAYEKMVSSLEEDANDVLVIAKIK